jgi:hypothetical protein
MQPAAAAEFGHSRREPSVGRRASGDMTPRPLTVAVILTGAAAPITASGSSARVRQLDDGTGQTTAVHEVGAMVLSSPSHGPELGTGPKLATMPPQCDGPPIARWDRSTLSETTTWHGVTWGSCHLVGTFDPPLSNHFSVPVCT